MSKMSTDEVTAIVNAQKTDAMAAMAAAQLAFDRAEAMDFYLGRMQNVMPTEDGRSQAVSTDVSDTIEGIMPHLMDIFCGSDQVMRFVPVGPGDEQAAEQETDYLNHVLMQVNDGFMIIYNWFKDALLSKNGFVKVIWEEREEEERETYVGLNDEQFAWLAFQVKQSDGQLEVVEHTEYDAPMSAMGTS